MRRTANLAVLAGDSADPEVIDATHGAEEWGTAGQDAAAQLPDLITVWVSDPEGDWDGPYTATVVVRAGSASAARDAIRESYAGPLCVVERDGRTEAELRPVLTEVADAAEELGLVGAGVEGERGVVVAQVWVDDDETLALADERWGDLVELQPILQPAD